MNATQNLRKDLLKQLESRTIFWKCADDEGCASGEGVLLDLEHFKSLFQIIHAIAANEGNPNDHCQKLQKLCDEVVPFESVGPFDIKRDANGVCYLTTSTSGISFSLLN